MPTSAVRSPTLLERYAMALERVTERLQRITAALQAAGVPYALVGRDMLAGLPPELAQRLDALLTEAGR